jgi:hypothetical protein
MKQLFCFMCAIASSLLVGCAGLGLVSVGDTLVSESKFDGSKQAEMVPAWVGSGSPIKLGLFKNTKMDADKYIMKVVYSGAENFAPGKNFHVKIDGQLYSFESSDAVTNLWMEPGSAGGGVYTPSTNWSSKDYPVTEKFINQMLEGKVVLIKLEMRKSYVEGEFHPGGFTTAKRNMPEFMATVKNGYAKPTNNRTAASVK